ncbi:YgaP family membrane protein [Methyloprofundus sp.]|uniref:YgaP family membrane protein n=1 Tax=Methyloprofundus sp. TaxID=2020875 RepID=UPI003D0FB46F
MNFDFKRMLKFEINVGSKEKQMRVYAGAALLFVSLFLASVPLLLIGLIAVATGYTGFCPVYAGMGKSTVESE